MRRRKAAKPERFVTEAERREALRLKAEAAAESFRRTGRVLGVYDRPDVLGAMIALGLASLAELKAAGAAVTERMAQRIGGDA